MLGRTAGDSIRQRSPSSPSSIHTHTPAAHPSHIQRPGTTITLYPEWYFYSARFRRGTQQAQTINCQQNPFSPQYDLGILVKHHRQPFSTKYNAHTYGIFYNCVPYCPLCSSQETKKILFPPLLSPFVM